MELYILLLVNSIVLISQIVLYTSEFSLLLVERFVKNLDYKI